MGSQWNSLLLLIRDWFVDWSKCFVWAIFELWKVQSIWQKRSWIKDEKYLPPIQIHSKDSLDLFHLFTLLVVDYCPPLSWSRRAATNSNKKHIGNTFKSSTDIHYNLIIQTIALQLLFKWCFVGASHVENCCFVSSSNWNPIRGWVVKLFQTGGVGMFCPPKYRFRRRFLNCENKDSSQFKVNPIYQISLC